MRILTLLTRLLNNDIVRTKEFSELTGVSSKSIQRDINDLNTFFYESDYWNNKNTKVVYSRVEDGYILKNGSYSSDSLGLLSLLIKIKSLTPILHSHIYNILLSEISNKRVEDRYILKNVLNHFNIRTDQLPGVNLMKLQECITKGLKVRISFNGKFVVKPLSLMYMHYDYWFTYEYNGSIHNIKVRDIIDVRILNSNFDKVKNTNPIMFEIDKSIWNQFKHQFSIKQVLKHNDSKVTALVSCTELDSYYIAYQLAPKAKMIGPQSYIDSFIERLDSIKNTYV